MVILSGFFFLLLYPFPVERADRLAKAGWNFMHAPVFALMAWSALYLLPIGRTRGRRLFHAALLILLLAPLAEGLQALTGREPDSGDMYMGWAGGLAAILYGAARGRQGVAWYVAVLIATLLAAGTLIPVSGVVVDRAAAARTFPVLSAFDSPLEMGRWRVNHGRVKRVSKHAAQGSHSMHVILKADVQYARVFMIDFPRDWSGSRVLALDVYSPMDHPRGFWFRVDDRQDPVYAERFQQMLAIEPGLNTLTLDLAEWISPSGRPLDISNIVRWGLFLMEPDEEVEIYVDHVRLVF